MEDQIAKAVREFLSEFQTEDLSPRQWILKVNQILRKHRLDPASATDFANRLVLEIDDLIDQLSPTKKRILSSIIEHFR